MSYISPNEIFAALGLGLAILALWFGLRHYTKVKSHIEIKLQQLPITTAIKQPSNLNGDHASTVVPPPKKTTREEVTDDSIMEEAELYSNHGRPAVAVKILQEVINRHPSNIAAWSLLLSNYSSLGKTIEFEKTAREFLKHLENHDDSHLWIRIQALGRTLDPDNPLYIDHRGGISTAPFLSDTPKKLRPIGDILIEMGVLTEQDMQSWLDVFDPIEHGRFGGYLLAHRVITLDQLDQALLLQQQLDK